MAYGALALLAAEGAFLLLWSSGFIGVKYGLEHAGTYTLLFYRYAFLSALLLVYLAATRRLRFGSWGTVRRAACMGILAHAVWLTAATESTKYGAPPGIVAIVASLQPLLTALAATPILGEKISRLQWTGLFVGFAGVVLVVADRLESDVSAPWWAYCLPLVSALSLTWATVWQRKMEMRSLGFMPVMENLAVQCWASAAILLPFAWGLEGMHADWNGEFIFSLLWLSLVVSLSAYGLLIFLLKHSLASRMSSVFYLMPPVTMVMDYFLFGNSIAVSGAIGLAVAAGGVFLIHWNETSIRDS